MNHQTKHLVNVKETGQMDIRQAITDKIIAMLEKGGNVARSRWTKAAQGGFPRNGKTGDFYRGVNVLILWDAAIEAGFTSNVWMTFKQAADLGAHVRKGEKGVMCAYFEMVKRKGDEYASQDEEGQAGFYPMCKPFWLFNVAQIEGLPESLYPEEPKTIEFNTIDQAEAILAASGANIAHGFDGAYYAPAKDQICMPARERFTSPEAYYATALHELTHWTGHKDRLNREFGKRFGDSAYAFEELVAELGAAFVVGHVGFVDMTIEYHAAYVENWIQVLKNDKTAIFTASKQASLAYDFILEKAGKPIEARAE
jgi:antirestriction protein ArdC